MNRRIETKTTTAQRPALHVSRFQVKATEARQFTGLASTWDLDEGGDMILPGAYAETLRDWKQSGRVIPLINQHNYYDAKHAIGKLVAGEETAEGLVTTFQLVNSPEGDEFLARVKEGIIDGLSIGYRVREWRPPTEAEAKLGVQRVLVKVELIEVSLVLAGMNPNALIDTASVKSLADSLAKLRRESLTDDDRKAVREIASLAGSLLRTTDTPPADPAAAAGQGAAGDPTPPNAPPGADPAAAPKALAKTDELRQRITALKLGRTINQVRHTTGSLHV